jgi:hypothetical protein
MSVIGPVAKGVTLNVWGADEPVKVSTIAVDNPPPDGVIVTVPLYGPLGDTVKPDDAVFKAPPRGPVRL